MKSKIFKFFKIFGAICCTSLVVNSGSSRIFTVNASTCVSDSVKQINKNLNYDNFCKYFKNYCPISDENQVQADTEKLKQVVSNFMETIKDVPEEDLSQKISEYIRNNQKNGNSSMQVVSSDKINEYDNDDNFIVNVRGVPKIAQVQEAKKGQYVFVGGKTNNSEKNNLSSGIFVAPYSDGAEHYTGFWKESIDSNGKKLPQFVKTGDLIYYTINKDAEFIASDYLRKIRDRMMDEFARKPEERPEWFTHYLGALSDRNVLDEAQSKLLKNDYVLCFETGDDGGDNENYKFCSIWDYNFRYIVDFVKVKKGFDFFDSKQGGKMSRLQELGKNFFDLCGCGFEVGKDGCWILRFTKIERLTEDQKQNRRELAKFWKGNNADSKCWLVDKLARVVFDEGLLAKLMGYDVVYHLPDPEASGNNNCRWPSEFLIVDWGNVFVFGD